MLAWKFFAPGAVAPFTGVRWPTGGFIEGRQAAGAGVHACALEDLPYWIDQELWQVELDGPITRARRQLIAARGRLLARVDGWPASRAAFTAACIERTRRRVIAALRAAGDSMAADRLTAEREPDAEREAALAIAATGPFFAGYVADVIRRRPYPGTCAYMAANAAAALGGAGGHDQERAEQAAWFREQLKL
jgi:hypothetical protein